MGSGHHESLALASSASIFLPINSRYEAFWWDRTVRLDGGYYGPTHDQSTALDAVSDYAQAVSIGSLTALRRFLETSIKRTDRTHLYIDAFISKLIYRVLSWVPCAKCKGRGLPRRGHGAAAA